MCIFWYEKESSIYLYYWIYWLKNYTTYWLSKVDIQVYIFLDELYTYTNIHPSLPTATLNAITPTKKFNKWATKTVKQHDHISIEELIMFDKK